MIDLSAATSVPPVGHRVHPAVQPVPRHGGAHTGHVHQAAQHRHRLHPTAGTDMYQTYCAKPE